VKKRSKHVYTKNEQEQSRQKINEGFVGASIIKNAAQA
jgi:hypothetical protein